MEKDLTTYVKDFILKYSDDINNKNSDALLQDKYACAYKLHDFCLSYF